MEECKYCKKYEDYEDGCPISIREFSRVTENYIGFAISLIGGKDLYIAGCFDVGRPSKDSAYGEKIIKINYCPICGRKL